MSKETTLKTLILTETAGKARTLKKFLGRSFLVISTDGFLRDLPKSRLGIDEENYSPEYIKVRGKAPLVKEIEKESLNARRVFFAMNPDGAGEFLSKQCCELFGVNAKSKCRIFLDELTKDKIKNLQDYARPIDENLVKSFQARQIIDKFVSQKIGDYLSCKIYRGVKVGRFRVLLLKLITEKKIDGKIILEKKFTPAVMQELAFQKLNFSAAKTRVIAEQLFEGVSLNDDERTGLIKFPHGEEIFLTDEKRTPESVKEFLSDGQFQLYNLIFNQSEKKVDEKFILGGECSDASLMAALDKLGIDWAEVYAGGISSLLKRNYITAENSTYKITPTGKKVLEALDGFFDEDFSSDSYKKLSVQFSEIAEGKAEKISVIENYCNVFVKNFEQAMNELGENATPQKQPDELSDEICDKCGKPMLIKRGRYGKFLACSGYPECKNAKPILEYLDKKCPKCGKRLTKRLFGKRNSFICEDFPACDFSTWDEPQEKPCKVCGGTMFLHKFKERTPMFYCGNENCETRKNHPMNKIIAESKKRYEARKNKKAKK
ncbi:MAG: topoisomerase DNA-binding C4 zinc finger domain-containing protein [Selenomonadaceae bacterium]|nr:topoisomerase DNA-binding C4 zinc finger domain-containing protein [Selenomonadaceae bacterium]